MIQMLGFLCCDRKICYKYSMHEIDFDHVIIKNYSARVTFVLKRHVFCVSHSFGFNSFNWIHQKIGLNCSLNSLITRLSIFHSFSSDWFNYFYLVDTNNYVLIRKLCSHFGYFMNANRFVMHYERWQMVEHMKLQIDEQIKWKIDR